MRDFVRRPSTVYFLFYFCLISLIRWDISLELILLWLGGVFGILFEWVDRLAYIYFTKPHEQLSFQAKSLISQKRYKDAIVLIDSRKHEQKNLSVGSILFLMVWVVAAFFVITSTGSAFASGMVMAIGLSVLVEMYGDWNNLEKLKGWLFWQIKRGFSDAEAKSVVVIFSALFVVLTLLLI